MSDKTYSLEWIQNEINYYSEMCVSVSYFDYLDVLKQLRTVTAKIARLVEVGEALMYYADYNDEDNIWRCIKCGSLWKHINDEKHYNDCPVTLWNKEAHE